MNQFVSTKYHTLSYNISAKGTFIVQGVSFKDGKRMPISEDYSREIVRGILLNKHSQSIKRIRDCEFAPDVIRILKTIKKGVKKFEEAALSPYTVVGHNRLMREFELMIPEDVTEN